MSLTQTTLTGQTADATPVKFQVSFSFNGTNYFNNVVLLDNTGTAISSSNGLSVNIVNASLPLPTGAATSAAQATILAATQANPVGAANFTVTPASVNSNASAVQIVAARTGAQGTGRVSVTLYNAGPEPVYYGPSGVTAATGLLLPVGASVTIPTTAAIYGILPTGVVTASTVNALEVY